MRGHLGRSTRTGGHAPGVTRAMVTHELQLVLWPSWPHSCSTQSRWTVKRTSPAETPHFHTSKGGGQTKVSSDLNVGWRPMPKSEEFKSLLKRVLFVRLPLPRYIEFTPHRPKSSDTLYRPSTPHPGEGAVSMVWPAGAILASETTRRAPVTVRAHPVRRRGTA